MLKKRKKSTLFHVKNCKKKLANALFRTNQLIGFDQVFQSINCNQLIAMHLIANAIFQFPVENPDVRSSSERETK